MKNTITLRKKIEADQIIEVGFTEPHYVKAKRTFFATIKGTEDGWIGYYETPAGTKLVRNGNVVKVSGTDPIQVIHDLYDIVKVISLDISDTYVDSLNHDGN
jgi:hypothetical protein